MRRSLLIALLLACATAASAAPLAELALKDLSGRSHSISELKGEVVLLNFWATWCRPCRNEMPLLSKIHQDYQARGVTVLGAAAHPFDEKRQVSKAARQLDLSFETWTGATTKDMERFGLGTALRGSVLIDREGRVAATIKGEVEDEEMRGMLDRLLSFDGRIDPEADVDAHDHFPEELASHEQELEQDGEAREESAAASGDKPERPSLVPS